ncbi:MAG: hypothetical protein J0G28_03440 [Afipia sp.]|nr:hypothetical protein [Afipia sp.]OJW61632.1 MAG: hypothetical protein BGO65_09585 [Afipia sp. 64-13]
MRPLSLVLAFAFVIAGPLTTSAPRSTLPGVGTFNYTGSKLTIDAPQVMAALRDNTKQRN